jgi:predicted O-methyltransferase YrrM
VWYYGRRAFHKYVRAAAHDRQDILAMQALAPLSPVYLPWSSTAMRPSAVAATLNDVMVHRRHNVVELGSGISTFYLGRLMRRIGGHLHAVEHDEVWAALLEHQLRAEGLQDVVTVLHAPLAPTTHGWGDAATGWFDEAVIDKLTIGEPVDLLVVDGPPAYRAPQRHARYPALPFFAGSLAPNAAVILDDIRRRGEQEVVDRWAREFPLRFRRHFGRNIAVGRAGRAFGI